MYNIKELSGSVSIALDLLHVVRDSPPVTVSHCIHPGKCATTRESNHGSGVCKEHYAKYYVPKSSILLAETGVWKISSVTCEFSSIKSIILIIRKV